MQRICFKVILLSYNMTFIKAFKFILAILLISVIASSAQNKAPLSLEEAVRITLENNPDITAAAARIKVSKAQVKESKSGYYPQISSRIIVPFVGRESGFFLDQLIWDFGRTSNRVKASKAELEASELNRISTENDLIMQTRISFYTVLSRRYLVQAALKKQEEFEKRLLQAQSFFDVGRITANDLTRAEVDLGNVKLDAIAAENNLESARLDLMSVMGIEGDFPYVLQEETEFTPVFVDIEEAIEQSVNQRSEIKSLQAREEAMKANVEAARKEFYPILFGRTAYRFEGEGAETPGFIAGVGLTFPIFEGFSRFAKVEEAKGELESVQAEIRSARTDVKSEIRRIYLDLEFAEKNIAVTKQALDSAEKSLELARERYRLERASDVELAEAEHLYASANASYKQTIYNYNIIASRLRHAMGEIEENYEQ